MLCLYIFSLTPLTNGCVSSAFSVFNFSLPLQNQYAVMDFVMLLLSGNTNIFLSNLYSVSGPTTNLVCVVGTWKQTAHSVWMVNLGVSAADPICVAAWASCQERDACAWAFRRQKFCFVFRFFFIASVWYRSRKPKVNAHRAFILSGSSCLASTELVSCGKACFADQKHNWTLYFWWHW